MGVDGVKWYEETRREEDMEKMRATLRKEQNKWEEGVVKESGDGKKGGNSRREENINNNKK
jgi:hypothetical protein